MNPQPSEWVWLDDRETVSIAELSQACAMSADELVELVEYGALAPLDPAQREPFFSADCIMPLRTAGKLRLDFDLDLFTTAVLMDYLARIEELERQVRTLKAAMPRSR
ncbi:MAG TPA: chaperone modulator CbpM [Burkholderiaceae bacterium]|nr:chaperone modulator CbpM [Burkholderiaceae bacterium]